MKTIDCVHIVFGKVGFSTLQHAKVIATRWFTIYVLNNWFSENKLYNKKAL